MPFAALSSFYVYNIIQFYGSVQLTDAKMKVGGPLCGSIVV